MACCGQVRSLWVVAVLLAGTARLGAQQTNVGAPVPCALSANGTGRVDSSNAAVPTDSMIVPTPPGSAPLYHHRAAARVPVTLLVEGPQGAPVVMAWSPGIAAQPQVFPGGSLELSLFGIQTVVDGVNQPNWPSLGAITNFLGRWTFVLGSGLPPWAGPGHLQAALFHPSYPVGYRLTASVTIEVRNDLDTLARNVTDAVSLAPEDPGYLYGTLSSTFLHQGANALQAVAAATVSTDGSRAWYRGIGPAATNLPPLPTGGPGGGQGVLVYAETRRVELPGCGFPVGRASTSRIHDIQCIEEAGVWKVCGDQRDYRAGAELTFTADQVLGFTTHVRFEVEDGFGLYGGISGATVAGPQLECINAAGQSTGAGIGTVPMQLVSGGGNGPGKWELVVELGALMPPAAASCTPVGGPPRRPLVEDGTGPRDVYVVAVSWNGGVVTPPILIPLRAALDPSGNPSALISALPANTGGVGTSLNLPGSAGCSLSVTLDIGTASAPALGAFFAVADQGPLHAREGPYDIQPMPSVQSFTICTPMMVIGTLINLVFERRDVFGNQYLGLHAFTP